MNLTREGSDSVNCPNCNSNKIYQEVSIIAKEMVSTGKIFDVDKENIDNIFEPYYCLDCGWSDLDQTWTRRGIDRKRKLSKCSF